MEWVVIATPRPLYPRVRHGAHCTGGWVGLRAGLDRCGKISPPTGTRSPDRPDRSESQYRLSYPGSSSNTPTSFKYPSFFHHSMPALAPPLLPSVYNGYRVSFPGLKRPARGVGYPHPYSAEVKERVELYLYALCGSSWPLIG